MAKPKTPMVAVRWRERWRSVPNLSLAVPNPKVVLRALVPNQKSTILKLGPQLGGARRKRVPGGLFTLGRPRCSAGWCACPWGGQGRLGVNKRPDHPRLHPDASRRKWSHALLARRAARPPVATRTLQTTSLHRVRGESASVSGGKVSACRQQERRENPSPAAAQRYASTCSGRRRGRCSLATSRQTTRTRSS